MKYISCKYSLNSEDFLKKYSKEKECIKECKEKLTSLNRKSGKIKKTFIFLFILCYLIIETVFGILPAILNIDDLTYLLPFILTPYYLLYIFVFIRVYIKLKIISANYDTVQNELIEHKKMLKSNDVKIIKRILRANKMYTKYSLLTEDTADILIEIIDDDGSIEKRRIAPVRVSMNVNCTNPLYDFNKNFLFLPYNC